MSARTPSSSCWGSRRPGRRRATPARRRPPSRCGSPRKATWSTRRSHSAAWPLQRPTRATAGPSPPASRAATATSTGGQERHRPDARRRGRGGGRAAGARGGRPGRERQQLGRRGQDQQRPERDDAALQDGARPQHHRDAHRDRRHRAQRRARSRLRGGVATTDPPRRSSAMTGIGRTIEAAASATTTPATAAASAHAVTGSSHTPSAARTAVAVGRPDAGGQQRRGERRRQRDGAPTPAYATPSRSTDARRESVTTRAPSASTSAAASAIHLAGARDRRARRCAA